MLVSSVAIAQGIGLLFAPLLTRIYSVGDFSILQIYLSILLFGSVIACLRYDVAIVLPGEDRVAVDLTVLSLICAFGFSLLAALVLVFWRCTHLFPEYFVKVQSIAWLIPLSIFGSSVYSCLSQWTLRRQRYKDVAKSKLAQSAMMTIVQISLGLLGWKPVGLLIGDVIGRFCGIGNFSRSAWEEHSFLFKSTRWSGILKAARRYRHFPQVSLLSAIVNSAGGVVPPLLIAAWGSSTTLGLYALADRILGIPTALVGAAVSQVYIVDAAKFIRESPASTPVLMRSTVKQLALIGVLPYSFVFLFGPKLFQVFFGAAWIDAGHFARIMAPMHFLSFLVWPIMPTLNLLEKQSLQFFWDLFRMVLTFLAIGLAHMMGWSATGMIVAYAVAMGMGYAVHPLLSLYSITRRLRREV